MGGAVRTGTTYDVTAYAHSSHFQDLTQVVRQIGIDYHQHLLASAIGFDVSGQAVLKADAPPPGGHASGCTDKQVGCIREQASG